MRCGARCAWWSIPVCTRWAGRASKRSNFSRTTPAKTDQDITVEVDRYIVWPGQALAYKLGQLKIRELRTEAEKKQGSAFSVGKFHDAVLESGSIPLDVLDSHIHAWLAKP